MPCAHLYSHFEEGARAPMFSMPPWGPLFPLILSHSICGLFWNCILSCPHQGPCLGLQIRYWSQFLGVVVLCLTIHGGLSGTPGSIGVNSSCLARNLCALAFRIPHTWRLLHQYIGTIYTRSNFGGPMPCHALFVYIPCCTRWRRFCLPLWLCTLVYLCGSRVHKWFHCTECSTPCARNLFVGIARIGSSAHQMLRISHISDLEYAMSMVWSMQSRLRSW